jgi:hydroxymethylpyrimidine/phosphomethylpyrimidine kinase
MSTRRGTPPVVLSIAATDSGGGAGLAADLATFAALGVHGACVVTAVTAQDTLGVRAVHRVPLVAVEAQLDAVLEDLPVAAVKTGMLASAEVVRLVAERISVRRGEIPLVVDPIVRATSGEVLADDEILEAYRRHLLPLATLVTPNGAEADRLDDLAGEHGVAVVRTGSATGRDVLLEPGRPPQPIAHPPVETANDHGTGCTFSAAVGAHLAHGRPLADAVRRAGDFTAAQLRFSSTWALGRGRGPIAHTITEGNSA